MPYSDTWATLLGTPPGTEQAENIDDSIRRVTAGLGERFASIIVDVTADPWVAKDEIRGKKDNKHIWVPPHQFHSVDTPFSRPSEYVSYRRSNDIARAGIWIPAGVTIIRVDVFADRSTCPSADWQFIRHSLTDTDPSVSVAAVIASGTTPGAGIRRMQSGVLAEVPTDRMWYEFTVDSVGVETLQAFLIYGALVVVNVPDSRSAG
jgi:hypothetical protein